jgi:peptide/nickel transport system ATP-binding protein/oligopeptide transport system ATP-binding protein
MTAMTNSEVAPAHVDQDAQAEPILEVTNLRKYFPVRSSGLIRREIGQVQAVDGVSFQVPKGGSLGLVGESGCGKSTTGRLITRLYDPTAGSMKFEGREIANLSQKQMLPLRSEIQMVFQDPYSSLNPRHTVGSIVGTPMRVHKTVPEKKVLDRVRELLEVVGLNPEHYNRYPNEFSGGQRQRIGVARALALQPKLLVADEPVSALDVSIQAQVVNLLQDVQREFNIAFLFIAHDLAIVRHFCPEIAVMYLGKIVEIADRATLYSRPHHPYTQALLSAVPDVKQAAVGGRRDRIMLEGDVPSPINPPSGCRFRTRCWMAQDICAKQEPPLLQVGKHHKVACHFAGPYGEMPQTPITMSALGVDRDGTPISGATPSAEDLNKPGFSDTWTDVATHAAASNRLNADNPTGTVNRPTSGGGGKYAAGPGSKKAVEDSADTGDTDRTDGTGSTEDKA